MRSRFAHRPRSLLSHIIRANWYRDVWLILVSGLLTWAVILSYDASHDAQQVAQQQRQGRVVTLTATCATLSGVIQAGRATILSGVIIKPKEFERNLERMGLPPRAARKRSAISAADAYAGAIAARVEFATGKKGLIRPDGTLDCALLRRIGRAR